MSIIVEPALAIPKIPAWSAILTGFTKSRLMPGLTAIIGQASYFESVLPPPMLVPDGFSVRSASSKLHDELRGCLQAECEQQESENTPAVPRF